MYKKPFAKMYCHNFRCQLMIVFRFPENLDVNPLADVVERVNDVYNAVVQSEECMERIACEIGGIAHDVGLKESPITK